MFLDEAIIDVIGGKGGDGCVSWRREKYVPKGGPDGGNGGHGGNIYFVADANTDTLTAFSSRKKFAAELGKQGSGRKRNGHAGEDLLLKVPPGTAISGVDDDFFAELIHNGDQVLVAKGGRGGFGNSHFVSSVRQRPDFAELGEPGDERKIKLELKLVADVGIIGYPSVGKSTLISVISAAKPKIADYPFTTLVPNLGVVHVDDRSYVVCDVPGLIEGASEGKGLGHEFLKHIERCGLLLHVLDVSRGDAEVLTQDYKAIRRELEQHSSFLAQKKELVVLNKVDLVQEVDALVAALQDNDIEIFTQISAATTQGTDDLKKHLLPIVLEEREKRFEAEKEETDEIPVLRPQDSSSRMGSFRIERRDEDTIVVHGDRIEQLVIMTDFNQEGGVRRLKNVCERIGLLKAIEKERNQHESVYIGDRRVDEYLFL